MITTQDYRSRVYNRYVSHETGILPEFDAAAAERRGQYLSRLWRGWLPAERDASIADLGCGNGGVLFVFKSLGYTNLTGVDISREQVHIARKVTSQIVLGDVCEFLESRPASFDLMSALDLIEHLQKDEVFRFLDACHVSLRPQGRLILQTPNADSCFVGTVRYGDFTHETCFNPHSLHWLLTLCGFERIEWREGGPVPVGLVSSARWLLCGRRCGRVCDFGISWKPAAAAAAYTRAFL